MSAYYQLDNNEQNEIIERKTPQVSSLYLITHLILSFFAIYLSWRCGGSKFDAMQFVAALCCPHLYIIWALATHGGCGVFDSQPVLTLNK